MVPVLEHFRTVCIALAIDASVFWLDLPVEYSTLGPFVLFEGRADIHPSAKKVVCLEELAKT